MAGVHWQVTPCAVIMSVPVLTASSYVCTTGSRDDDTPLDAEPVGVAADDALKKRFMSTVINARAHLWPTSSAGTAD